MKNKGASNTIANARFTFGRGLVDDFVLDDQKQDGLVVTYNADITPGKINTDAPSPEKVVDVQSTMTILIFVNDA